MDRRKFLQLAAASSAGAAGTILISSTAASSLLHDGKAIITGPDVQRGEIITPEMMLNEQVSIAQLGDNLAKIVLSCRRGVTFVRSTKNPDVFEAWGDIKFKEGDVFTQHSKYKLVQGGDYSHELNAVLMRMK